MMRSKKTYLFEAMYNWITDSGMTPHVLVDAAGDDVVVPSEYVIRNRIVLNISEDSIDDFSLEEEALSFNAYFGANNTKVLVFVPMRSVLSIFAQESSEGLTFEPEDTNNSLAKRISDSAKKRVLQKIAVKKSQKSTTSEKKNSKPKLKIVKD